MGNQTDVKRIDLQLVAKRIRKHKMLYIIILPLAIILSSFIIISVPRTYTSKTSMAPEISGLQDEGTLKDLASNFGLDLSNKSTSDAISPLLYPELMDDNKFVTRMFNIPIKTVDNKINTTYYDYLTTKLKTPWWDKTYYWLSSKFTSKDSIAQVKPTTFNPYQLSRKDNSIVGLIRGSIKVAIDKKTGIISITTEAQDPMVCKMVADAVREQYKEYIIDYRTRKLRSDVEHYKSLVDKAKYDYEKVRREYGKISDADMDVVLESVKLKQTDLENDMQLKYNTYTALTSQLKTADAKLQEHTPVFTTIQGAEVPVKPSGPKRMIFVFAITFAAFILTTLYVMRDTIFSE